MERISFHAVLVLLGLALGTQSLAQIDPVRRDLIQMGYNQPMEGRGSIAGYAYYYRNRPEFVRSNLTLRLAIAPVYLDSELGIAGALGPRTDLGLGISGGGFADSYSEIRGGHFYREESFTGHGGDASVSLYHRFNPDAQIPLYAILRGTGHFVIYERDDTTAAGFELPEDRKDFFLRTGLRWGGMEPVMFADWAMELSAWYEGQFRTGNGTYGLAGDRFVESQSHQFWGRALLDFIIPDTRQNVGLSLTAGLSVNPDRFSAYRLGGALPMVSEFPLHLPGYYFQELSTERFVLLSGRYSLPLDHEGRWRWLLFGSTAVNDYLAGLEQPGHWHTGVGSGLIWESRDGIARLALGYSYGIDAMRTDGRGAHNVGLLLQIDLEADRKSSHPLLRSWLNPNKWRGFDRIFGR